MTDRYSKNAHYTNDKNDNNDRNTYKTHILILAKMTTMAETLFIKTQKKK